MISLDVRDSDASPEAIVDAATGFMAAKQLFTASRIGLFAALADGPATAAELAARTAVPARSARIVADAMVGLGLLRFDDDHYRNTEAAATYLAGGAGPDLRPFLAFWDAISYPQWLQYEDTARRAEAQPLDLAGERQSVFFGGVHAYNALHARMLVGHYDVRAHSRMLDLGGLSAAFLAEATARHPQLRGTFLTGKAMIDFAGPVGDRIEPIAGDPLTHPIPAGHDAVLLEHVIHRYDPEDNRTILQRARLAVDSGATLLVVDFFLDPAGDRALDALLAGEYLVIDGTVVYPEAEVHAWLDATGWRWRETRPLPGSPRLLIADAD